MARQAFTEFEASRAACGAEHRVATSEDGQIAVWAGDSEAFAVKDTPRIHLLARVGGVRAAALVAVRYAALLPAGQHWRVPPKHIDFIYDKFGIRNEGFASPFNSSLLGKPNAKFCSLFPDTDEVFGSLGSFFSANLGRGGGWAVNPPYTEKLLDSAAAKILDFLPQAPKTWFFYVMPDWTDSAAYSMITSSRFLRAAIYLEPGTYAYYDYRDRPIPIAIPSHYFCLGGCGEEGPSEAEMRVGWAYPPKV